MSPLTTLTNQKLSLQKQGVAPRFWHNTIFINVAMSVVLLLLGFAYLGIVNSTAADTFAVASLDRRIEDTKNQNQRLELDIAEVLALPHVSAMTEQSNLVAATSVHYLDGSSAVAFSQ